MTLCPFGPDTVRLYTMLLPRNKCIKYSIYLVFTFRLIRVKVNTHRFARKAAKQNLKQFSKHNL